MVLVEFQVKDAFVERFGDLIRANAAASLEREGGCQRFDVLVDPDDRRCFVLYEVYDDDAAFELHLRSPHYKSFAAAIEDGVAGQSIRRLSLCDSPATAA